MNRNLSTQICVVLLTLTLFSGRINLSYAEESKSKELRCGPTNLNTLVSEIVENNPELIFYQSEISAAKGESVTAQAWNNPELSSTLGNKHVSSDSGSDDGISWSISMQQPIEWPGRIELRKLIANKQIQLAELGLSQFKSELNFRAQTYAYDLFSAQEKASASREVATRYQKLIDVLKQRETAGVTPLLERRIIEATSLGLERRVIEAELEAKTAKIRLNQLRGNSGICDIKVSPAKIHFVSAPSFETLFNSARTNNFELLIRKETLEQQGFKVDLAKNEKNPAFSVGPYITNERASDREVQIGIGVSIPLSVWDKNTGRIATEEAHQLQASTSLTVAERDLERKVAENLEKYKAKLSELKKWSDASIKDFKEAANLADEHYRLGSVPVATYVEVQKQYLETIEALLETRREALAAKHELERLTGMSLDGSLLNNTLAGGR